MKIIKRGAIKKKTKRLTCSECDTVFEYEPKDVEYFSDQRDNYSTSWVVCPLCKHQIDVK